jgi:hypothetical protein
MSNGRRKTSVVGSAVMGIGGVLWETLGLISAYTTAGQLVPASIRPALQNPTWPWVLLLGCFCVLWWEVKHPDKNIDTAGLHEANTTLRNIVDSQRAEISSQKRKIDELCDWSTGITEKANEFAAWQDHMQSVREEFGPKLAEIIETTQRHKAERERDAPRNISDDARRIIAGRLKPLREVWVAKDPSRRTAQASVYYMPGVDCAQYAQEFYDLFESIGFEMCTAVRPHQFLLQGEIAITDTFKYGLVVMDYSEEARLSHWRPDFGNALRAALSEAGIDSRNSDFDGPAFGIVVGAKIVA